MSEKQLRKMKPPAPPQLTTNVDVIAAATTVTTHDTTYPFHPALKLKGAEEDVDLSLPPLFGDQVHVVSNYSSSVAVQEDTQFFFILSIITVMVIDEVYNEGGLGEALGDALEPMAMEVTGFFMDVLDPLLGELFKTIGGVIAHVLGLNGLDKYAKNIINGGLANTFDIVKDLLGDDFQKIVNTFKEVGEWIDIIREGLDALDALDFIDLILLGVTPRALVMISNGPQEEERTKITDANGNTGYLSSKEQNLVQGSGGLEDLVNVLKRNPRIPKLKDEIQKLQEDFTNDVSHTAMNSIMVEVGNILEDDHSAFQAFLRKTNSLGSIQFLLTAEASSIAGGGVEAGISIDIKQILYFLSNGFNWDPAFTKLASFHVGYELSIGASVGGDVGLSIGYHTSRVTAVRLSTLVVLAQIHN